MACPPTAVGFPLGAVGGKAEFMKVFDHRGGKPPLPWSGTFTANPVTMTAGEVTLRMLDAAAISRLNALGSRLRDGLAKVFSRTGWPGQVTGIASMFRILGHQRRVVDYRSCYHDAAESLRVRQLQAALLSEGFYMSTLGMGFLSTPMVEADIDAFLEAVERVIRKLPAP